MNNYSPGHTCASQRGFTLVEVLIAIFITALIGLGSWQLLNSSLRINERTADRTEEFSELQRFMLFLARDMQQLVPRSVRNGFGDVEPALSTSSDFYELAFSKVGWRNPLQDKRSELQRVAYELEDNTLYRHYWKVLDRAQDSQPIKQPMLTKLDSIEFSFLTNNDRWVSEWPPQSLNDDGDTGPTDPFEKNNGLPRAIKVNLEHSFFGELSRTFDLVRYQNHQVLPTPPNNSNGGSSTNGNSNSGNTNTNNNTNNGNGNTSNNNGNAGSNGGSN